MLRKLILTACLVAGVSAQAMAGTVTLHGSTTVSSNVMDPFHSEIQSTSGQTVKVVANGSSRGIADLVGGSADLAMISAPLDTVVAKINKKKPGSVDGSSLVPHEIGKAQVAFVVHKSNSVKNLTLAQVGDILSGKITNWSELGGPDAPIVVVAETKGGGVRSMVEKELIGGDDIAAKTKELPNATQVVKVAAQIPSAIGIASVSVVNDSITRIATDKPIEQPLILVSIGAPNQDAVKVIEAARKVAGS